MKKVWIFALCLFLTLALFGCTTSITVKPHTAEKWFDYWSSTSEELPWDTEKTYTLTAFPDVTFRWTPEKVSAEENSETTALYEGMPVHSVYFCDVTGDGKPELCSTVSFGSGMIDEHIVVYDYVEKATYCLWDRGNFDYFLNAGEDGTLMVEKRKYMEWDSAPVETIPLTLERLTKYE